MPTTARDRNRIEFSPADWIGSDEWEAAPEALRLRLLTHAAEVAVRLKRQELRKGIGADGAPLDPVLPSSRPDGATGPPLDPHYGRSRSVRNLRSSIGLKAGTVTLWWTGVVVRRRHGRVVGRIAFGAILGYHARGEVPRAPVRNVLDLTETDWRKLQEDARRFWRLINRVRDAIPPGIPVAAQPLATKYPHLTEFLGPPSLARARPGASRTLAPRSMVGAVAGPISPVAPPPVLPGLPPDSGGLRAPVLPGRPMGERLAAYTEGDRKVDALIALGAETRTARRDYREASFRVDNLPKRIAAATDPDEQTRLRALYDSALQERSRTRNEIAASAASVRVRLPEVIGAARPQEWEHTGAGVDHPKVGRLVRESEEFLGPLFESYPGGRPAKLKWDAKKKGGYRANYDIRKRQVNLHEADDTITAVHERGHHIEDVFPGIALQARRFLKHRVGDEPLKTIYAGTDEQGWEDEFSRYFGTSGHYVGKHYDDATEITSMGLQALYEDPVGFAQKDPEYAKWVLGILDGSLR